MCGRVTISKPEQITKKYNPQTVKSIVQGKRYNVCPTQMLPSMINVKDETILGELRWGLVPPWATDVGIGAKMINARAETVAEKPAFRSAFRARRCVIFVDGFYEWKKESDRKQPYYFQVADGDMFAMAGLYEIWRDAEGEKVSTCTIITTTANSLMDPIHHRMPVILPDDSIAGWLDGQQRDSKALEAYLQPLDSDHLRVHPVSTLVNSPANDVPACIELAS